MNQSTNQPNYQSKAEWEETKESFFEESALNKACAVAEAPFVLLRKASVPITAEDSYSRPWLVASVALFPLW